MPGEAPDRRLAAILSADVVGFSRLMAEDEDATARTLPAYREEIGVLIRQHRGRVVDSPGDNLLADFPTGTDAVECAVDIQRVVSARNASLAADRKMEFRIGVHLGEVTREGDRIYGDGVNIAARLEGLAEAGGVCISEAVREQVRRRVNLRYEDLGEQALKNMPEPVRVYRVAIEHAARADSPAPQPPSTRIRGRRFALGAAILLLASALSFALWQRFGARDQPAAEAVAPIRSLAVLPFQNLMKDPAQDYFADGMTEAVISELAKVSALKVISRTSTAQYRDTSKTAPEIARELGVEGLIEGSVLRDGDQVRITAQLIQGPTDRHLWAESYTNTLTNVLRLHSDVARAIVGAVGATLTTEESRSLARSGTVDPEAYEEFLRGMHAQEIAVGEAGLRASIGHFERAITLDRDFALAWAQKSVSYAALAGWGTEEPKRMFPVARSAAMRSLELDPNLGPAYFALATVTHSYDWEWKEAERLFRRGIRLAPSDALIRTGLAWLLVQLGRNPEALAESEVALKLDPKSKTVRREAAAVLLLGSEIERAGELLRALHSEDPTVGPGLDSMVGFLCGVGDFEGAIRAAEEMVRASPREPYPPILLACAQAKAGQLEKARETIDAARRSFGEDGLLSAELAVVFVDLGEIDEALRHYERGFQEREWMMTWIRSAPYRKSNLTAPSWTRLREDPRYWDLIKRMNFPPFPPEHPGYAEDRQRTGVGPTPGGG